MKVIYKFPLQPEGRKWGLQAVNMPIGACVVVVNTQRLAPVLWAQVDLDEKRVETRYFRVFDTGEPVEGTYVGTAFVDPYVWHVYEVGL